MVVDCPGNFDGGGVIPAVLKAADYVVLVTEAKPLAFPPLMESVTEVVRPSGVPFKVLINNVDMSRGGKRKEADARDSLTATNLPVFKCFIRSYTVHEEASLNGELVTTYPKTADNINAIDDMRRFATELIGEWSFAEPNEIRLTDNERIGAHA